MAKLKTRTAAVPVPQDDGEARAAIREIGDLARAVGRIEAAMNDAIAACQEAHGAEAAPLKARIAALQEGLRTYAEAHRARLTAGGRVKFHRFSTGMISWRARPPKVSVRGVEDVIERLAQLGLGRFLRTRTELNKEAMLADAESRAAASAVQGVTIGSEGEDFVIEPFETELAEGA